MLHQAGQGDDIVAQLAVGEAAFWVAAAGPDGGRFGPRAMGGATGRILLVADDPDAVVQRAIDAGATGKSRFCDEHGLGRIIDPFRARVGDRQADRALAAGLEHAGRLRIQEQARATKPTHTDSGIMWVIFDHLRPSGHIMRDMQR